MDEYLLRQSDGPVDTTEFFRQYMAGFVINRRESAVSHCGSSYIRDPSNRMFSTADTRDLLCYILGVNPLVQNESLFFDSVERQNSVNLCPADFSNMPLLSYSDALQCSLNVQTGTERYPICDNLVLNDTNFVIDGTFDATTLNAGFRLDGTVREISDNFLLEEQELVGRQYAPIRNTEITGATVYYNNQVSYSSIYQ